MNAESRKFAEKGSGFGLEPEELMDRALSELGLIQAENVRNRSSQVIQDASMTAKPLSSGSVAV